MRYGRTALLMLLAGFMFLGALVFIPKHVAEGATVQRANRQNCIIPAEFGKLEVGMSRRAVYELLDGPGVKGASGGLRDYHICGKKELPAGTYGIQFARTIVWFKHGKLKEAYWLVMKLHPAPPGYAPDGLVPCDAVPPALPYCDPNLPEDTVVCTDPSGNEVECTFRQ